ncbi:muellerian-inhibiting factor isoform X2 [Nelusetta ayraudi]|uniref:muellerian-inhibiting factor isoform X2 n=1 Tax=Nelusetta ayraudi TaxID=303726 RepID=UPI003F6E9E07
MLVLHAFLGGALMICTSRPCAALQLHHEQQLMPALDPPPTDDSRSSSADLLNLNAPCFVDDVLAALRDSIGDDGQLTSQSLSVFGFCSLPGQPSGSLLLELARETGRKQEFAGLEIVHPVGALVTEEAETGTIELTFDLPDSSTLKRSAPVVLLALEAPPRGENLDVTFSSQSLQPDAQSVCISEETSYVLLTGRQSVSRRWRICAASASPHKSTTTAEQTLRDVLIGGKSRSRIGGAPLLLFSGGSGADGRSSSSAGGSAPASSLTAAFLCELRRFLGDFTPQERRQSPPLRLTSLQSLPAVTIGPSSSEALLAALINSSTLTVFSFAGCCSSPAQVHGGELSLSSALLEELRQRLAAAVARSLEVMRQEQVGGRAAERLRRLVELSSSLEREAATGASQYCAFLLLKALQTVGRSYEAKRGQRAARASSHSPARGSQCGLRSLTVSLERHVISPASANINNCHGSCQLPLANASSHVILLNLHIAHEGQGAAERPPCCVPVAYEDINMVHLDADGMGTELITHKDVVATECECR